MNTTTIKKPTRNGLVFDTLAMAQRLRAVGVPEAQAYEQVEIVAEIFEHNMATKRDVAVLRKDMEVLRKDIADLRSSTKRDIADVRKDMEVMKMELRKEMHQMQSKIIIWVAAMLFAQAGFITALQKLL